MFLNVIVAILNFEFGTGFKERLNHAAADDYLLIMH
jgi:hypothetical protein